MEQPSVVNVFEITGMPEAHEDRENVVVDSITTRFIHIRNSQNGRYFLMRVTKVNPVEGIGIRKLDPDVPQDMADIAETIDMIVRAEPGLIKR